MSRKKSLLIGINYTGSQHELRGCRQDVQNVAEFLNCRGYSDDPRSQVILRDDMQGPCYPSGHNILVLWCKRLILGLADEELAAIDWLVCEPGTCNFLHYSGHGVKFKNPTGNRPSGILDTIVPVDFQQMGQINSDLLHEHLITRLPPNSTLFVILDCCHSGSALELPYVYKSDDDGNVSLLNNLRQGAHLLGEANDLIMGGFSFNKFAEAQDLYAGATSFFRSFKHRSEDQPSGLDEDDDYSKYAAEHKMVTMLSGCRDDQTSADASINGMSEVAMSWAFLETMKRNPNPSYVQVSGWLCLFCGSYAECVK